MNNVSLIGRITKAVELKKTKADTSIVYFSVAVKRKVANKDGEKLTDFFNCVAFGSRAEFLAKFAGKSTLVGLEGRLQSKVYVDEYEKRHASVDVVCESVQILHNPNAKVQTKMDDDAVQEELANDENQDEFKLIEHDETQIDDELTVNEDKNDLDKSLDQLISDFSNYFED